MILTYPFFLTSLRTIAWLNRISRKRNYRFASSSTFTYTSAGATATFYLFDFRKK